VRLYTRNGYDWTKRYPLIVEAALRIRSSQFVLDGEAVLLGVDGISDFEGMMAGQHNEGVQLYAFDILALIARISGSCLCIYAGLTWGACSHAARTVSTFAPFEQGEIGPDLFKAVYRRVT
jgi:hypothetical protein